MHKPLKHIQANDRLFHNSDETTSMHNVCMHTYIHTHRGFIALFRKKHMSTCVLVIWMAYVSDAHFEWVPTALHTWQDKVHPIA